MVEGVTVNNDSLVLNKGEGNIPSPPPSIPVKKSSESNRDDAVKVDVQPDLIKLSQSETETQKNQAVTNSNTKTQKNDTTTDEDLKKQLKETIQSLNEKIARLDREVEFRIDERINKNYISVIDKKSKNVIREFPPEEIRNFIARFNEINEKLNSTTDVKSLIINLEV